MPASNMNASAAVPPVRFSINSNGIPPLTLLIWSDASTSFVRKTILCPRYLASTSRSRAAVARPTLALAASSATPFSTD